MEQTESRTVIFNKIDFKENHVGIIKIIHQDGSHKKGKQRQYKCYYYKARYLEFNERDIKGNGNY